MTAESEKKIDELVDSILKLNAIEMVKFKDKLIEKTGVAPVAAAAGGAASGPADTGPKQVKLKSVNSVTMPALVRFLIKISKENGHSMGIKDASALFKKVSGGEAVVLDFIKPDNAEKVIGELTELGITCA